MRLLVVVALASTALSMHLPATYAEHDVSTFDGLSVVFIDLGTKGDSTLVVFPNGKSMLIDGGLKSSYPNVKGVIDEFDLDEIDVVIASHPDQDHIAGLTELLADTSVGVGTVLKNHIDKDTKTYGEFLSSAPGAETVYAGTVIDVDPTVRVEVLSPPDTGVPEADNASEANSNSLVILLVYGDIEFLFTADATYTTEEFLQSSQSGEIDVDIMNAPHHGSKHASTRSFIDAASPEVVIFSAEKDNQYGHPHQDAVDRYVSAGVTTMRTLNGDVVFQTDGTNCSTFFLDSLATEASCFDGVQMVGYAAPEQDPGILIAPTEKGTLNVGVWIDELSDDRTTKLHIDFINPALGRTQEHIDYRVLVTKDGTNTFGPIPLTHTSPGKVGIPMQFAEDGDYDIQIDVEGILFRPIPPETVTITLSVGGAAVGQEPVTEPEQPTAPEEPEQPTAPEEPDTGNGGCLIATAAFGSEMAPQVQLLRELRDGAVMQTDSGNSFMSAFNQVYYSFSPSVADLELQYPAFKELVRIAITPMISSLSVLDHVSLDSEAEVLVYGIGIILLNIGMYLGPPVAVVFAVRRYKSGRMRRVSAR